MKIDELIKLCMSSSPADDKLPEIKRFVQNNPIATYTDYDGRTPLHFLASRNNTGAIDYLLSSLPGLDINHKDDMGWTVLSNACYMGAFSTISQLIAKSANPLVKDFGGKTLLHLVAGNTRLSSEDKEKAFKLLIDKGVNPKVKDLRGQTYNEVLEYNQAQDLLLKGADPFGRSILHWTAYAYEAYKEVYASKTDWIASLDDVGRTPLMYAVGIPQPNIPYIQWLISKGCSVTQQDKGGKSALHFAARWGNEKAIECLLENGAELEALDDMNQDPIDIAKRYMPESVRYFEHPALRAAYS